MCRSLQFPCDRNGVEGTSLASRAPPEIRAGFGKSGLLLNRLLAHNWLIPSKIIESTPSIENDELPPPIGIPGEALELLLAKKRIDAAAAPHRAGVKRGGLE